MKQKLVNPGLFIATLIFSLLALEVGLRTYHGEWGYENFRFRQPNKFVNVPALRILYSKYDVAVGHCRRYNRALLRNQLMTAGLEIRAMRYWGITLMPIALVRKLYLNSKRNRNEIARVGFQPPGPLSACLLSALETVEHSIFRYQPAGTSLLAIARKAP